jgi:hypothetical protein
VRAWLLTLQFLCPYVIILVLWIKAAKPVFY